MSNFNIMMVVLSGGAALRLVQFVAILRRLMRPRPAEDTAFSGINHTGRNVWYPPADSGVRARPVWLSPHLNTIRKTRLHRRAHGPGASIHGPRHHPARQRPHRRNERSYGPRTASRRPIQRRRAGVSED